MHQRQSGRQVSDDGRVLDLDLNGLVYHPAAPSAANNAHRDIAIDVIRGCYGSKPDDM
jgi:hypothetical protein